jgi:hypothetical protein
MKRTCNGCRAEEYISLNPPRLGCSLGYRTKYGQPLQECPKPRTIREFVELLSKRISSHSDGYTKSS